MLVLAGLLVLSICFFPLLWLSARLRRESNGSDEGKSDEASSTATLPSRHWPKARVLHLAFLAMSALATLVTHSFIGLLSATLVLGISVAWRDARVLLSLDKRAEYESRALSSYQRMILLACVATLGCIAPHFISWTRSFSGRWMLMDGHELLCLVFTVIIASDNHPFRPDSASALLIRTMSYVAIGVVAAYCMVPVYRLLDMFLVFFLLVFFHLQKPTERPSSS